MREIKFRIWNTELKRMYYTEKCEYIYYTGIIDLSCEHKKGIWMQFSGLRDNSNNKNEVYEGDIIEQFGWQGEYYIVEFIDCAFYAVLINNNVPKCLRTKYIKLDELYDFQVIGNKYDNIELLEGGKI